MRIAKCKLCSEIKPLQKHHYIPQRIKKTANYIYICHECHKKIHPESDLIISLKRLQTYHDEMKKFIKTNHASAWQDWKPHSEELKMKLKKKYGVLLRDIEED